ncbi:unnamed protein product [Trichobilharzia szidati]|nr:unnamed protein product [Trichobilharzia szidati]
MDNTNGYDQLLNTLNTTINYLCNLLHQMSSAEIHYAYKLFNHLCEYTIELLVNKLISNQAEYIHPNEVNKQILNFVQLKHSTNCDLLFNETKLTNTNTNEYNLNHQFEEMICNQTDRTDSSNCNPIDLSQKVHSPNHLDMSKKSINKCSINRGDLLQKNHHTSETMNNSQLLKSHSEEEKSNDVIDLTSGTKKLPTSKATTYTSSNLINADQLLLLHEEKKNTKDSHRPMDPKCTNDARQVTLRSQNQSMKEVQNPAKMHMPKTAAVNSIQFKLIPVDRAGIPLKTPGLIHNNKNNTHKLYISSPFPIGSNISSIYLMPKNMTSFINASNNVSPIQQTLNLLHQNRRDDNDGDAYVDADDKDHFNGGIHQHHQHYNKEDNDIGMKDEINNGSQQNGEKERCSTCKLSFKHPIDFVKHIQMVHVGLQFRNRVTFSKYPENRTFRTSSIKRRFPAEHLRPSKSKLHHADNDNDNDNDNNKEGVSESDFNNHDNKDVSNEGNDKVNADDDFGGGGGAGGDDVVGDDDGDNNDDGDDDDDDDGDEDMKEEDNDEYIPVKSTLCNTRQRPYEFRRMKKSESLTG